MDFEHRYIDELIYLRNEARIGKNWALSDAIRDFLDSKHCFVFDTDQGQVVYHRISGSRQELVEEIKEEKRAIKIFDAWLHSVRSSELIKMNHENN